MGAIDELPDGTFRPNDSVTRTQVIKIAIAAAAIKPDGSPTYTDVLPSAWYSPWVSSAERIGVFGPGGRWPVWYEDKLNPETPASRAEAAMLLVNLLKAKP